MYYGESEECDRKQMAVIARFYCTLLESIFYRLKTTPDAKIALSGELPKFIFPTLEDIYYLKHNQRDRIKSSLMKGFKSIDDLQKDAEFTENIPLIKMIKVKNGLLISAGYMLLCLRSVRVSKMFPSALS